MASRIVKDSRLPIFVKEIPVANTVKSNDFVAQGAVRGLAGFDAKGPAQDGLYYVTVDTAALIRVEGVAIAFTDKAPVYVTPGGAITATASGNALLGYADRPKQAAAGNLFIQLVPSAV